MNTAVQILGWSLAVASTFTAIPQTYHIYKNKNYDGVSPSTPALAAVAMISWVVFTSLIGDLPALASSLGPLIAWAATLVALVYLKAPGAIKAALWMILLSCLLLLGAITKTIPTQLFGAAAAVGSILWALPQLVTSIKLKHESLAGISVLAYSFLALEAAAWILYAIGTKTPAYAAAPLLQLPACAAVAYLALKSKARQKSNPSS